ncbi:MAG TPA: DUF3857 domain-containing protein [Alphaproteobacteria bacterium]|nr:DUF3857 domain-containing protein [Alphaproteobacteria bacterium]
MGSTGAWRLRQAGFLAVLAFLVTSGRCFAQKEDWLPVTPEDQQVHEVPGDPGAGAIQLYYADYINDAQSREFIYKRIKVLNEKGRDRYSNVEIPVFPEMYLTDLKARTIHPDGSVAEFTGKPFVKTLAKTQGFNVQAKSFTMPEVTVGSIIEYKYRLNWGLFLVFDKSWTVQHDLYTVRESFLMEPHQGSLGLSYTISNLKQMPVRKGETVSLEMHDVPAFVAEDYMPPEDNYKPQVRFFYGREVSSADKFWEENGRIWYEEAENFIGNHKEVKDAAAETVGDETDPEKKLRKLYVRAQQIRNLSYERSRSADELSREKIVPNENAGDVIKHGFGYANEITLLLVALARASGVEASVLKGSNRRGRVFDPSVLSESQLALNIASVKVGGQDVYLEPGVKHCPYGTLPWELTSTPALRLTKKGGYFVAVPPAGHDQAVTRRTGNVTLGADGSLAGELNIEFLGQEAFRHRLDAEEADEAGREEALEAEVRNWLPNEAVVKLIESTGWDMDDAPLTARFRIDLATFASWAGKRLLVPEFLLHAQRAKIFQPLTRNYPIYFPYAFTEQDVVVMKLPAGYAVESLPSGQTAGLPYARYQSVNQANGSTLVAKRALLVNGILFDVNRYAELKDFFNKVQAGDESQVVINRGGTGHGN